MPIQKFFIDGHRAEANANLYIRQEANYLIEIVVSRYVAIVLLRLVGGFNYLGCILTRKYDS